MSAEPAPFRGRWVVYATDKRFDRSRPRVRVDRIAHRGCGAVYPENTVRAARRAASRLPAVEVDVRRCGSGELVCVHDERVDRVTDGSGPVAEFSLAELRSFEVEGSGEPIPTLADVVSAVPEETTLQIELKEPGIGADVVTHVRSVPGVRLSSFLPEALREARDSGVPTGYLFDDDPEESRALAVEVGCSNVHPHWRTCAETDVVEHARERGLGVYAWGVGADQETFEAARRAGVDGATVDRPDL